MVCSAISDVHVWLPSVLRKSFHSPCAHCECKVNGHAQLDNKHTKHVGLRQADSVLVLLSSSCTTQQHDSMTALHAGRTVPCTCAIQNAATLDAEC